MGQTLTHGVYLPDEGERNCYNGLASNWTILDGAVGTVAEHTSALSGKAPLVHTHSKSDITDFPAYGNAAGTICEGNDARLSDARTPVAHTHTKSDVTDLFNSANTWTGENTFSGSNSFKNITLSATAESVEIMHNTWHGYEQYYTRGTSNYPNYDTFLKWNSNRYNNTIGLYRSVGVLTDTTEGATVNDIDESFAYYIYHINAKYVDFMGNIRIINDGTYNFLAPLSNGDTSLGTSTNKWKTLNGINPGALSLPNLTANSPATQNPPNGWISIDTTNWDKTGNLISYIPPVDGWISIITDNSSATNYIRCAYDNGDILAKANGNGYAQGLSVFLPVLKNVQIGIRLVCTTIGTAKLYPCLGNV